MRIEITLKNYRCFSDEKPATFVIGNGFTAFIGVNNSGKSSLLRFFYEFRHFFASLGHIGNLISIMNGTYQFLIYGTSYNTEMSDRYRLNETR